MDGHKRFLVSILNIPKAGTVGIHNSLLPAYQGGASLNWALIKDYSTWGTTLFHLEENIDAGEIIFQEKFNITDNDDINTLFLKSDKLSIEMINRYLPSFKNLAPRIKQNPSEISKTPRRRPEDGAICWKANNRTIFNLVRALRNHTRLHLVSCQEKSPDKWRFIRKQKNSRG